MRKFRRSSPQNGKAQNSQQIRTFVAQKKTRPQIKILKLKYKSQSANLIYFYLKNEKCYEYKAYK